MIQQPPRVGDKIRDARFRMRVGIIEATINGTAYYVAWNDGSRTCVPISNVHAQRLAGYGFIMLRR